ncbi:hypothetical protein C0J26_13755 [Pseudomonas baetica]|nr:hypothetical protein C0J26_13755 [Pseudomonas baetica]
METGTAVFFYKHTSLIGRSFGIEDKDHRQKESFCQTFRHYLAPCLKAALRARSLDCSRQSDWQKH